MVFVEHTFKNTKNRGKMVGLTSIPQWLEDLLGENFFNSCLVHEFEKKNEKNIFCLDCCESLCLHCLLPHQNHRLLQIRRYVYQDVLRLNDAQKLLDCSSVQSYTTNRAKVVFLKQRPMTRQLKGLGNICIICERNLQDPYLFCSISCKVHHMVSTQVDLRKELLFNSSEFNGERVVMSFSEVGDGGQMTPDSVLLELPISLTTCSGSSSSNSITTTVSAMMNCRTTVASTATTEFIVKKKKRSSVVYRPVCNPASAEFSLAAVNRRKGVPQRSPMF